MALNRDLLELIHGPHNDGVARAIDIASTWVVQPHDQASRWRWALFWLTLLAISLFLTSDLSRTGYLFEYYRESLRKSFLLSPGRSREPRKENSIDELRPQNSGLPVPIFLATWLKPNPRIGAPSVPVSLAITPNNTRLHDHAAERIDPEVQSGYHRRPATLADAVATSGAAISPQMTSNASLAIMMDCFGARLGMWFRRGKPAPSHEKPSQEERVPQLATDARWVLSHRSIRANVHSLVANSLRSVQDFVRVHFLGCILATLFALLVVTSCGMSGWLTIPHWIFFTAVINAAMITLLIVKRAGYPGIMVSWTQTILARLRTAEQVNSIRNRRMSECWPSIFVSDGGYYDYLGVTELLRRRCELMIVSDAGVNTGATTLESLASMCEKCGAEFGVRFLDLDHDAPIDFSRLLRTHHNNVPQPFIAMRVKYPSGPDTDSPTEGLLFYVQMSISDRDPIEIQQIRHQFPHFPDEPTTNQFYTDEQVAAYRDLGYHIGSRLCNHLHRWTADEIKAECDRLDKLQPARARRWDAGMTTLPLFHEFKQRLIQSYTHDCFNESIVSVHDIFGEAIATRCMREFAYPSFNHAVRDCADRIRPNAPNRELFNHWTTVSTKNADVAARYLSSIMCDMNNLATDGQAGSGLAMILDRNGQNGVNQNVESWSEVLLLQEIRVGLSQLPGLDVTTPLSDTFLNSDSVLIAKAFEWWKLHLSAMAIAAQRMHHGHMQSNLQVGGHQRLEVILDEMMQRLRACLFHPRSDPQQLADTYNGTADIITDTAYRLCGQVFRTDDKIGVVSFVQVLCLEVVAISRLKIESRAAVDLEADFRQILLERLESGYRSEVMKLIADYLAYLHLGTVPDPQGYRRIEAYRLSYCPRSPGLPPH